MNRDKLTTTLAATEASLKRWQTRLKRAATKVHELDKTRRRYQLELLSIDRPVALTVKVKVPKTKPVEGVYNPNEAIAGLTQAVDDRLTEIIEAKPERDIPSFLDRSDPLIAERMTAARKKAEEEARHKMPLSGKAAMAAIMAVPVTPKKPRKRKA